MIRDGYVAALVALAALLGAPAARAQQIEPRAYSNIPVGVNFVLAGYAWTDGSVGLDPALPFTNGKIRTDTLIVGLVRSLAIGPLSGKVDFALPYGWLSGSADYQGGTAHRDVQGFGDARLRLSVNLLGAPPLDAAGFRTYRQDLVVGASLQVSMPSGQYDPTRLVNLGANRWYVKPEVGISKAKGDWVLELNASATIFTVNDDFYGGHRHSQDPVYATQAHLIYNFGQGLWSSLDGTYYFGGITYVNGVAGSGREGSTRVGLTLALPVTRRHSIKLYGSTGVSTRTGDNYDLVGIAWQYRWGGGV